MTARIEITASVKAWTTCSWNDRDQMVRLAAEGKMVEAIQSMHYTDQDMSSSSGWVEVGVAIVTVTLHPRDTVVAAEVEGLKKQLEEVRAENYMRENAILDRISKLTAIEYREAE
jgi:hypothetical protein